MEERREEECGGGGEGEGNDWDENDSITDVNLVFESQHMFQTR